MDPAAFHQIGLRIIAMSDASVEKASQGRKALDLAKKPMDLLDAVENDPAGKTAAASHITMYKWKTNTR
jgi:hypothetical protein